MSILSDFNPERLRATIASGLPGYQAHQKMWTSYRPILSEDEIIARNPRMGAVMIQLYQRNGHWHLLLIQRPEYDGVHSGQLAFPGGKLDEADSDLLETAYRENWEEVGVSREQINYLGALSRVYIPPSNFWVQPYLSFADGNLEFTADAYEVKQLVEIPLNRLLKNNPVVHRDMNLPYASIKQVPGYLIDEHFVWGATAIMLSEFIALCERL